MISVRGLLYVESIQKFMIEPRSMEGVISDSYAVFLGVFPRV